jgi:NAD-dependent dihydropyrimidine dehydrogenase PreA subunit
MPYVVTEACVDVKDQSCVRECPVDCVYEGERQLYIHPEVCIDCGACEPVCPENAIYYEGELSPPARSLRRKGRRRSWCRWVCSTAPGGTVRCTPTIPASRRSRPRRSATEATASDDRPPRSAPALEPAALLLERGFHQGDGSFRARGGAVPGLPLQTDRDVELGEGDVTEFVELVDVGSACVAPSMSAALVLVDDDLHVGPPPGERFLRLHADDVRGLRSLRQACRVVCTTPSRSDPHARAAASASSYGARSRTIDLMRMTHRGALAPSTAVSRPSRP